MTTLSPANQDRARRKMAVNGSVAMLMYALATLFANLLGTLTMWLSILSIHAAILATLAAFGWPLYLSIVEERKARQRTV